jgi:acyl-CoA synthetase (AMP-forming)/AMP-acid ligase II
MTAPDGTAPTLANRVRAILALDPEAPAIELAGQWHPWRELSLVIDRLDEVLTRAGMGRYTPTGMLLRNTPSMVGAMLGAVVTERCIVTLNPHQGDAKVARDVLDVRTPVVLATAEDWEREALRNAVREIAAVGVALTGNPTDPVGLVPGLERAGSGPHRKASPGIAVEMLTSGTTGPPKRIQLETAVFERTVTAARRHYGGKGDAGEGPRLGTGVAIVSSPFVHMSGLFRTLLNVCEGRKIALLPRFAVEPWVDLVRRHRPRAVSLVPAAVRMVLEAEVDPVNLSSIEVVTSGTAKLEPEVQLAFERRFGIPVLPSYGATEFAGGVAGWTLALHREWGETKRGSVGRPQPGREVRVVEPSSGEPLSSEQNGLIEIRSRGEGAWQGTTDLGHIDADGFLWIVGRADDAILRGGFKIMPDDVARALVSHPAVREACVIGLPDPRLGQVPVAAVELYEGTDIDGDALLTFARERLASYQVPAQIRIVRALPRTPSLKVSRPEVRALFQGDSR